MRILFAISRRGFGTSTAGTSINSRVIDRERLLDELDGYLRELRSIAPAQFEQYRTVEKKRACERLLQVSVETVIAVRRMKHRVDVAPDVLGSNAFG